MKTLTDTLVEKAAKQTTTIELDGKDTAQFYEERASWKGKIKVVGQLGEEVDLPWRPSPSRMHAEERYFVNGTEIKPAFGFWSLGNSLRGISNVSRTRRVL